MKYLLEVGEERVGAHFAAVSKALLEGGCDGILFETLNCWKEAELGLRGLQVALEDLDLPKVPVIVCLEGALRSEDGVDFMSRYKLFFLNATLKQDPKAK